MHQDFYRNKKFRKFLNLNAPVKRTPGKAPLNVVKNKAKSNVLTKIKKPYPRLLDTEYSNQREIFLEFSPYSALAAWYYESAAKVYAYLRANLNSRQTVASSSYEGKMNAVAVNKKNSELNYKDLVRKYSMIFTNPGRKLEIRNDVVLLNTEPQTFTVSLGLDDEEAKSDLSRKLSKLFGKKFEFPTNYATNENGERVPEMEKYSTGLKGIDFYSRLNFPIDPYPGTFQPQELDISPIEVGKAEPKDEDEDGEENTSKRKMVRNTRTSGSNVKDVLKVVVEISQVETHYNKGSSDNLQTSGLSITFKVMPVCQFPLEYALWATNSTDITEFVPKLFREHFDNIGHMQLMPKGGTYEANLHARTMHFGNIKDLNNDRIKEYGIEVRPRVNEDNFTIRSNGAIIYVPDIDNTDFYVKTLRESYSSDTTIVKQNSEIPELFNKIILVDWINDQLAYTDSSGKPSTISLSGAIALDNVTIRRKLNVQLHNDEANPFLKNFGQYGNHVCAQFNLYSPGAESSFGSLFEQVSYDAGGNSVSQLYDIATEPNSDEMSTRQKTNFLEFVRLCGAIALKIMDCNRIAISTRIEYKFFYHVFGIYIKRNAELSKNWAKEIVKNSKPAPNELKTSFKIPNVPGINVLLPHQQELGTVSSREDPPNYLVMSIAAGGGKTLQLLIDALLLKSSGKIKTAMIVCPGGLVKEWTTEINKMTKGEVNVIPITTKVIEKMRDHLGFDKLKFIEYLKSAPINSIYICSVNFLGLPKDHFDNKNVGGIMQYGESFVRFFPNVQILRQLNPDYIAIDESHFLKNYTSRRTKSFFALSPVAKYRRIASGTISADNPADMVPQYGTLNPAILGDKDSFINKYGIGSNGKFVGLQTGMEKELDAIRRPYVNRVQKNRSDWAFLLPQINTRLTRCHMTDNQQAFYDFMFTDEMKKLRNDPKIQKLLEEADESKAKKIERLLETKLHILEEFVNAPDISETFHKWAEGHDIDEDGNIVTAATNVPRAKLTKLDMISCKVSTIDDILDRHLVASKNKVIIFGINKVVSRHIFTYSRHRNLMIHYAVSGSLSGMSTNEALMQFRNNPKYRIITADAGSMRVGLNLQMADMVFYVQTEWSPGDQEQAFSRAMRPDVGDTYRRDSVTLVKLFAENTYEVAKTAKLINKEVVNKQVDNSENPEWDKFLENGKIPQLKPIKMNIDFISSVRSIESPVIKDSVDWYKRINAWEVDQFRVSTEALINYTARRLGKDPKTIDLKKDAMLAVDSASRLPGSKYIFTPLESGAIPVDRRNLNMVPIAIAKISKDIDAVDEDEDDDDVDESKIEIENNAAYQKGDLVYTEYGYGYIQTDLVKQIRIRIPGFPKPPGSMITLSKMAVFIPRQPEIDTDKLTVDQWKKNFSKLNKEMIKAGDKGITFITNPDFDNNTVKETREIPPKPSITIVRPNVTLPPPDPVIEDKPKTQKDRLPKATHKIDIVPIVINGVPCLAAYTTEEGYDALNEFGHWYKVPSFIYSHIRTFSGAQNMAKYITDTGLTVPNGDQDPKTKKYAPNQLSRMQGLAKKLRGTTDNKLLVRDTTQKLTTNLKNSLILKNSAPSKGVIKLYTILWNDQLFITAPIATQTAQINKLKKSRPVNCGPWITLANFSILTMPNFTKTKQTLAKINDKLKIENIDEATDIINDPIFKKTIGI